MSNIISKKLGEHEIAWVDAEVGKEDEKLILLPPSSTPPPHKPVLVGDLNLSDFKQFLENKGWQVEFAGGALRCGEYVMVRKIGDSSQKGSTGRGCQQSVIEGPCARTTTRSGRFCTRSCTRCEAMYGFSFSRC